MCFWEIRAWRRREGEGDAGLGFDWFQIGDTELESGRVAFLSGIDLSCAHSCDERR